MNKIIIKRKKHIFGVKSYEVLKHTEQGQRVFIERIYASCNKKAAFKQARASRTSNYQLLEYTK
jgi:hypothetical protein